MGENTVFVDSTEEIEVILALLDQAEKLLGQRMDVKIMMMSRILLTALSFRHKKSLKRTIESIRSGILKQEGYDPSRSVGRRLPGEILVFRDSNNVVFFLKHIAEAPSVIPEIISESKKSLLTTDWKDITYWNLGKFKESVQKNGIWLSETGVLLFKEETKRLGDGEIVTTKDWDQQINSYVVENGLLHRILGNSIA
jgi:hypothetical protein